MTKNYIPSADLEFLKWVKNLFVFASKNHERFDVGAPEKYFGDELAGFEAAMEKLKNPNHGKIDVSEKNEARKACETASRIYVQGFLARNPNVSKQDKEAMKLNIHDTIPTPVGKPVARPDLGIKRKAEATLELHIKPAQKITDDKRAYYGSKIVYGLFEAKDPAPTSAEGLNKLLFTKRKKELMTFESQDSGKKVYFVLRYENSKGEAGPWSKVFSAFVP